jgi:flagellar biosynthesis protein FlhF
MRIKSYFAGSIGEAMEKARRELGPDAMLMNSKKTEMELRSLGAYEVVFAVAPEAAQAAEIPGKTAVSGSVVEPQSGGKELARELAELRKQIETVKRSVDRGAAAPPIVGIPRGADGAESMGRLTAADFSADLAADLAAAIERQRAQDGALSFEAALRAECDRRLKFAPSLGVSASGPRAVVLAGTAGVGKTTTLVKLALRYGLRARLPLQLLSLDTLRIGGWEHLASYARIAGIPCQPLHTPAALDQAFAEHFQKRLLLIDTPGFSPGSETQSRGITTWLAAHRQFIEVQLVLSAAAQPRINLAIIEGFAAFAPAKLLFTHLDEAESPGPLLETALRSGLPVSFLAGGQQVPEDLEEASLDRLLGSLAAAGQGSRRVASAA